jgi:hypothetical protein
MRDGQTGKTGAYAPRSAQIHYSQACMHTLPIQAGQAFFWITPLLYNTDARVEGKKEGSAYIWI